MINFRKNKGSKAFKRDKKVRNRRQQKKETLDISNTIEETNGSEMREKRLQSEYEHVKEKEATINGEPISDYLKWRKNRLDFEYLLDLGAKAVTPEKEKPKSKKQQLKDRVSKIAFQGSKLFPHHEIVASVDGKGGYAVHGWLQENFPDEYEDLIDNYVLDRMCYYAKRYYRPEVIKFVRELDLKDMVMTKLNLREDYEFNNYPGLKFRQVIILANDITDNAITWIPNYPHEIDGYDVKVNFGPANLGMLGFCLWNVLLCVLLHSPGKNQCLFEAKIKADDINELNDDIKSKVIHQLRTSMTPLEDKLDEVYRDALQSEKKYSDLMKKVETRTPSDIMEDYYQLERRSKRKHGINWKNLLLLIIVFIVAGIMIFLFLSLGNSGFTQGFTNSTVASSKSMIRSLIIP